MLGGLAPVFIFVLKKEIAGLKLPVLPIPFYLDENLTGVLADEHSRHISVEVSPIGQEQYERTTASDVNLVFKAKKGNVSVTAFLALFEMVMKYVNKQDYSITLFYDDVFMMDASLKDFETDIEPSTDTRQIRITLSNRPEKDQATQTILKKAGNAIAPFIQ